MFGLVRRDLEMVYGEFPHDGSLYGGSDDEESGAHIRRIGNGELIDHRHRINGTNQPDDEGIENIRSRLAAQLDGFEKELGEVQEVISDLASDAQDSVQS